MTDTQTSHPLDPSTPNAIRVIRAVLQVAKAAGIERPGNANLAECMVIAHYLSQRPEIKATGRTINPRKVLRLLTAARFATALHIAPKGDR